MVTSSIARNETNRILENAIGNVRSYPARMACLQIQNAWLRDRIAFVIVAWYRFRAQTDNFDRGNKEKLFLFNCMRISVFRFRSFLLFFIPKILEYIRSTSTRIGGGEERKEGKIRVVAQKTTNPFGGSSFECAETSESLQCMTARSRYGSHFCCVWFNFS